MENKLSASVLAEELAASLALTHQAANDFVRSYFDTVIDGLLDEGMVTVKGLGTFRLSAIEDRESVDVNTGERITLKGYRKVVFTPCTRLKEQLHSRLANVSTLVVESNLKEETATKEKTSPKEEETPMDKIIPMTGGTLAKEAKTPQQDMPMETPQENVSLHSSEEEKMHSPSDRKRHAKGWIFTLLALLLLLVGFLILDWACTEVHLFPFVHEECGEKMALEGGAAASVVNEPVSGKTPELLVASDTTSLTNRDCLLVTTKELEDSEKCNSKPYTLTLLPSDLAKDLASFTIADTVNYRMNGTLTTHCLQPGETLVRLARMYYGDKRLWPYIVKYNGIKDANHVCTQTLIKIPYLESKE